MSSVPAAILPGTVIANQWEIVPRSLLSRHFDLLRDQSAGVEVFKLLWIHENVFNGIHDALVAQPINLIEKTRRGRAHDLEMLSVAGQEILPTRYTRHGHLTRSSPGSALSAMLLDNVLPKNG